MARKSYKQINYIQKAVNEYNLAEKYADTFETAQKEGRSNEKIAAVLSSIKSTFLSFLIKRSEGGPAPDQNTFTK